MKNTALLLVALMFVVSASASVDLFLTKGPTPGMKSPDTFNPEEWNFLVNFDTWAGNPDRGPHFQDSGTPTTYFLWAEMALKPDEEFAQIYGIDLKGCGVTGGAVLTDGLFYRHKKTSYLRWNSGAKIGIPDLAAAVTARGVEAPANSSDLAVDVDGKTYALLGAIDLTGTDPGTFELGLGAAKFAIRITDKLGNTFDYDGDDRVYPDLTIQGQNAYEGPYTAVTIVPEPASMMLVALGALYLRRR